MKPSSLPRWLQPAPDSLAAGEMRLGRPLWTHFVHLVWSVWVFLTPLLSDGIYGFTLRWVLLTLFSYPLFLWLYTVSVMASPRRAHRAALCMVLLCLALLPWYPSGLSYFVFGCVMLQQRSMPRYIGLLAVVNAALVAYAGYIGYPWQSVIWMPIVTAIIGLLVMVERMGLEREAALKLSHDEVRRLAALAERERIGRDLHDLLGHTLSMVALKSDLAARLLERDADAARGEIAEVSRVARDALAQVRGAVSGIRAAGIAAELASAKLLLETDGVSFDYRLDDDFSAAVLPAQAENALAMCVREAATNIQRHARAQRAEAGFGIENGEAVLQVQDDGRGSAIAPGNGLSGMRERIEALGGRLRIDSQRGAGTRIEARVPLAVNDDVLHD
ncbi:MAG: sensor histidine kinase [Thermomonas sp.]|uniref:sensor histidine kinase n=1 Tax=Thermomonas sp. TaxID=1971895 RepID=UPI0039E381BB